MEGQVDRAKTNTTTTADDGERELQESSGAGRTGASGVKH